MEQCHSSSRLLLHKDFLSASAVAQSSVSLWTTASSSCSSFSLSSASSPRSSINADDIPKVMNISSDTMDDDVCSAVVGARDQPQLPISASSSSAIHHVHDSSNRNNKDSVEKYVMALSTTDASSYANLPSELILYIFKFLVAAHDLRSAILVCKLWCSCGMDLLWSKPSLLTLSAVEKMIHTMSQPDTIFPYTDYIRRLNLSFLAPELTDSILVRFASCSRLERLLLAGSLHITAEGLSQMLSSCSGLYSLDLSEIPAVTDALLENVAAECPKLHTLYLGSCTSITDESIVRLATSCPQLKRIKLSQCALLTDRSVSALTKHCPQLMEVDLTNCSLVSSEAIQSVFENLPQIRDINLTLLFNITNAAFSSIHPTVHRFEQLRILNLTSCALITDETLLRIIPAAPRLRSLALTKCDKITDIGASVIKTLGKHLHYLHLGHCAKITDKLVAMLAQHCTRLRYLDLACCSRLTDASVFALAQLPKLRRIGLVKCSLITDHGIHAMLVSQVLPQTLERIHLSYCMNLSEGAVAALVSQCTKLTHLSLTGVAAFISPNYQKFCRAPPSEFTAHQREVFCVFSGKGVRELRHYMQENPAVATLEANMESLRDSYRRISSSVARMMAGTEEAMFVEGEEEEEEDEEQIQGQNQDQEQMEIQVEQQEGQVEDEDEDMVHGSLALPPLAATARLVQVGTSLLATSAGLISLPEMIMAATGGAARAQAASQNEGHEDSEAMEDVIEGQGSSSTFTPPLVSALGSLAAGSSADSSFVFLDDPTATLPSSSCNAFRPHSFQSCGSTVSPVSGSDTMTIRDRFPVLQHPHHRHHSHHLQDRLGHGSNMDIDKDDDVDIDEDGQANSSGSSSRVASPGALARTLDREAEGSGAGSASPTEEEDEDDY